MIDPKYKVDLIDAFTKHPGHGNRAGVVLKAGGLNELQMQEIAGTVNVSETAFVLPPTDSDHDFWVRYFTPIKEVPSCGHATIATGYAISQDTKDYPTSTVLFKTGAGILPIEIIKEKQDYRVVMTQGKVEFGEKIEGENFTLLLKALDITSNDLMTNLPIQITSTGHSKVMIPITSKKILNSLNPDLEILKNLSERINCNGYFVFTLDSNEPDILIHGRMFAPAIGIPEDPVTGNANGPAGAYLAHYHVISPRESEMSVIRFRGKQGEIMGRPGTVDVTVWLDEKKEPNKVQVAGCAVKVNEIVFNLLGDRVLKFFSEK